MNNNVVNECTEYHQDDWY